MALDTGLSGSTFFVTGASGGIGGACARALAAEGARVVLHAHRNVDAARRLIEEDAALSDARALVVAGDVSSEADTDRMFDSALERFGRLDGIVVNAGVWDADSTPIHRMALERFERSVSINLTGAFLTTRAFFRHLDTDRREHAGVVLVGSTAAMFGEEGHVEYAAAKAGLIHGMTRSLKNEIVRLAPKGRVNAVCPGWTRTAMAESALEDRAAVERAMKTRAIREIASAEDIAGAVVFLLSPRLAGHVTGEILTVSAGMEGRLLHDD